MIALFLSGTATGGGTDFTDLTVTVTFNPNENKKACTVTITDDQLPEADEIFTVALSNPGGSSALGVNTDTTVTIIDDNGE